MIEYRPSDDSLYVNINDGDRSVWSTETIDERCSIDFAEDGSVIAILFSHASLGIQLDGLPEEQAIRSALVQLRTILRDLEKGSEESPRSGRVG